jgi:BirA family transcriptional regulator, biotin operon repressor / biotin---[acetyl-CoA-carboxylase] ligase
MQSLPERNIMFLDVVDSTNNIAKKLALEGCKERTVIIAGEQTNGRGRKGKVWYSERGKGLYMSVVLKPCSIIDNNLFLTLAASVAAAETISEMVSAKAGIKWPNDILLDNRKVCGILTETVTEGSELKFVIVGVGVNTNQKRFPEEMNGKATSLREFIKEKTGIDNVISDDTLSVKLLDRLDDLYYKIEKGYTNKIIEMWRSYSIIQGRRVKLKRGGKEYRGTVKDIDEHGRLMVICDNGDTYSMISGEAVFFANF